MYIIYIYIAKSQTHGFEPYAQGLRYSSMSIHAMNPMDVPLGYKWCETTCNYQDEGMEVHTPQNYAW